MSCELIAGLASTSLTIAKARSTSVRYLAAEAEKRGFYRQQAPAPKWTREALEQVAKTRLEWIRSNREGRSPFFERVEEGHSLPRRALGPHSVES